MTATLSVTRSLVIKAAPERVWEKLTNRDTIPQWLTEFHFTEFKPGTKFTTGEGDEAEPGEFVIIEPPRRFAFRWTAEQKRQGMTLVTITLEPVDHGTLVTVTESELELLEADVLKSMFERNSTGWGLALAGMANLVEGKSDVSGDGTDNR